MTIFRWILYSLRKAIYFTNKKQVRRIKKNLVNLRKRLLRKTCTEKSVIAEMGLLGYFVACL